MECIKLADVAGNVFFTVKGLGNVYEVKVANYGTGSPTVIAATEINPLPWVSAKMISRGTGSPAIQPAISIRRLPQRSAAPPATTFASALSNPPFPPSDFLLPTQRSREPLSCGRAAEVRSVPRPAPPSLGKGAGGKATPANPLTNRSGLSNSSLT